MAARYTVESNGDIALVAATAKTIVAAVAAANSMVRAVEVSMSFDGVTASNEPVTVELGEHDGSTTGTRTTHTPLQTGGPTRTVQATAFRNYTVEPTVISVMKRFLVRPDGGLLIMQFPLGREFEQIAGSQSILLRNTAPEVVNCQGYIEFEEG